MSTAPITLSPPPAYLRHMAKCPAGTRPVWAARNGRGPRSILYVPAADWNAAQDADARAHTHGVGPYVTTYDHRKRRTVRIAVAPCGLGCRCAAAWQPVDA